MRRAVGANILGRRTTKGGREDLVQSTLAIDGTLLLPELIV